MSFVLSAGCSSNEPAAEQMPSSDEMPIGAPPAADAGGTAYSVPADPNATYSLLGVTKGPGTNIIAMTQRTGSSGTSYSNREIDCGGQLARYIGEGDTPEEAQKPAPNPGEMAPLVEGSSTHTAVQVACNNQ
ncbi:hypothetical protein OKW76_12495 [Sphingomonas sp. S1-29]|uniref:hypothetical protein n=1 Tax=Sphingomonas sp. S1-29 TaxID=2991074 RepID=UPI00223FD1AD|nr:hypothetical protein [Sphingomonas sp. S1-29]UZK68849.1 hypothetical protein OKW76_12495 [Sphingomonas sp. S1-29]